LQARRDSGTANLIVPLGRVRRHEDSVSLAAYWTHRVSGRMGVGRIAPGVPGRWQQGPGSLATAAVRDGGTDCRVGAGWDFVGLDGQLRRNRWGLGRDTGRVVALLRTRGSAS